MGKWNQADNFRVPCVRVTLNEEGEHVYEGWSDVMKGVFSSAAQEVWLAEINRPNARHGEGGNKLRTYALFKSECKLEAYLQCTVEQVKWRLMSRFRMGVSPLRIEQGRFEANGLNNGSRGIPCDQRICQVCNNGIEDELHFFTKCPAYQGLRQRLFTQVHRLAEDLFDGEDAQIFIKLMATNVDEVVRHVVDFVWDAFKLRRNRLKENGILV